MADKHRTRVQTRSMTRAEEAAVKRELLQDPLDQNDNAEGDVPLDPTSTNPQATEVKHDVVDNASDDDEQSCSGSELTTSSHSAWEVERTLLDGIGAALNKAHEDLIDEGAQGVFELENLVQTIKEAVDIVESIKKYRDAHQDWNILAVSFSRIKKSQLTRLGLSDPYRISRATFTEVVIPQVKLRCKEQITSGLEKWSDAALRESVISLEVNVGTKSEARSRMIIDQYLLAVIKFCQTLQISLIAWPELTLAKGTEAKFENEQERQSTFLTGKADYGMLSVEIVHPSVLWRLQLATECVDVASETRNIGDKTFLMIEAKSLVEPLEKHIPQAVSEALVALKSFKTNQVAFCLTNSSGWIYGLIAKSGPGYTYWFTETLSALTTSIETMTNQFNALVLWATTKADIIHDVLTTIATTQKKL